MASVAYRDVLVTNSVKISSGQLILFLPQLNKNDYKIEFQDFGTITIPSICQLNL